MPFGGAACSCRASWGRCLWGGALEGRCLLVWRPSGLLSCCPQAPCGRWLWVWCPSGVLSVGAVPLGGANVLACTSGVLSALPCFLLLWWGALLCPLARRQALALSGWLCGGPAVHVHVPLGSACYADVVCSAASLAVLLAVLGNVAVVRCLIHWLGRGSCLFRCVAVSALLSWLCPEPEVP